LIGAGALIPEGKSIPDNSLVMGAPGKVVREVTPEHLARMRESAEQYVDNWQRYRRELRADDD
jgi:carbonic anhydrase/acetyltransferase-like protein (isoleucine patch superfamily)